jgi:sorbitol-specific phosphotransferase system component IIBC
MLSGFEIAYGIIEPSLAIIALFALVNVGIALVTSYLVMLAAEKFGDEAGL